MAQSRIIDHEAFEIKRANSDQESFWDGCQLGFNSHLFAEYRNHFYNYVAGDWTITETGSGSRIVTDEVGGVLLVTNAAADDDANRFQLVGEAFKPAAGKRIWVEGKFKISDATQSDFLFGIGITDTAPLATADAIKFQKDDGDTNIDFLISNGSVDTLLPAVGTIGTSYIKYGFKITGTDKVEYWIDGIKKGTSTVALPATEMRLSMLIQNGEAVAKTMSVDYIHAVQEL